MASLRQHAARHIQNYNDASTLEPHWGYVSRVLPCTNDPGSCAYLDLVYGAHDRGMVYTGIIWITILAIVLGLAIAARTSRPSISNAAMNDRSALARLPRAIKSSLRRRLTPDSYRPIFGRSTRLQVTILALLVGYLTIWSFVGLTYEKWVTPVKKLPGVYNTRTTLGPWCDRIGVLAYALTPLSVLLGNRESLFSVLTGVPYQKFNFLHRWLGYVIFLQSGLHTVGWCVVELRLYQPQPSVGAEWIKQTYMIWGVVAMALLTLLVALSTPWGIRLTGYEFFRKAHYVLAMIYIGACWGHWEQLKCFLLPSLLLWFADRGARIVRTALLHHHILETGHFGFAPAQAAITLFPDEQSGDVLRLDFENDQDAWSIGQHYYLCFPESSIWQSHPFTPLNAPKVKDGRAKHSYILRAKQGETKKVAALAREKLASSESALPTTPIILTGAYGEKILDHLSPTTNILCIAGGTGITYVLPVLLELASQSTSHSADRRLELIWAVRHANDLQWIREELDILRGAAKPLNLTIRLFATRECRCGGECHCGSKMDEKLAGVSVESASLSSASVQGEMAPADGCEGAAVAVEAAMAIGRPDVDAVVQEFVANTVCGRTAVVASGPGGMISDVRSAVARCNDGRKVWLGKERFDMELICDDRLEW